MIDLPPTPRRLTECERCGTVTSMPCTNDSMADVCHNLAPKPDSFFDPQPADPSCRHCGTTTRPFCFSAEYAREKCAKYQVANEERTLPPPPASPTESLLATRGETHGPWILHAQITQDLKATMESTSSWDRLSPSQREALSMIAHKIGRILAGNPDHQDHWDDIAGYATLVSKGLI